MRILILAYSYAPACTPRAFRWTAIAEWAADQGHHVDVICAKTSGENDFQNLNGVYVHRVGGAIRESFKTWLNRERSTKKSASIMKPKDQTIRAILSRYLTHVYNFTLKKIMWPDFAWLWYFPALWKSKLLIEISPPDVIISVSIPFTAHLVGLSIKRKYSLPWLVDIGDPFSFMTETPVNNHSIYRSLNFRYESKVLRIASAISVTTEGTKSEYYKSFIDLEPNKILVIPPLFVKPKETMESSRFFDDQTKVRLIFAGTLYSRIRNPTVLLKFFNSMLTEPIGAKLELHFFGEINDCEVCFQQYSELIGSKIFIHGLIPRDKVLCAMREATILVNLGNKTGYQMPSKIIEYIMLAKPVLHISPLRLSELQEVFLSFECIFSVTEESLSTDMIVRDQVKSFIEDPPPVSQMLNEQFSAAHSLEVIGKSYIDLINKGTA